MLPVSSGRLALPSLRLDRPTLSPPNGPERLGLDARRDGWLLRSGAPGPRPLWVAFHGAGGDAQQMLGALAGPANAFGAHLLAVDARRSTWDLLLDDAFGPDTAFLQAALEQACGRAWIQHSQLVAIGYSDGASYALTLALRNGRLFSHAIAWAPGFFIPSPRGPFPDVYVAHGLCDEVLPVEACGRRVASLLTRLGATVTYDEHAGTHALTPAAVDAAFAWLAREAPPRSRAARQVDRPASRRA